MLTQFPSLITMSHIADTFGVNIAVSKSIHSQPSMPTFHFIQHERNAQIRLPGCYTMSVCKQLPKLRRDMLPPKCWQLMAC